MARPVAYAELHSWSNFTFLEGGSHPEDLVDRAVELELQALAITDRDGLYGAVRFAKRAKERGLAGIIGSELTFEGGGRIVLLVQERRGYAHLCELISLAQLRGSKADARLQWADFEGRTDGLIALSGGAHGIVERELARGDRVAARRVAGHLRERFGERFFLELQQHFVPEDARRCNLLLDLARDLELPYVATNGAVYARKEDVQIADVIFCVKEKTTLEAARAAALLRANAEYHLKSPRMMAQIFAPYPAAIRNTLAIAERCTFRLEKLLGQFPLFPVEPGKTRQSYLRELVYRGASARYETPLDSKVERQLEYELGIIAKMDLAGYFLIVWDIVRAAGELGVLCQGRGSAANSAVCYALGITAIDPVSSNLLFERFLSEERNEIPDIDVDFAHQDREQIIQYIYNRYGRTHAAMAAEVITYHTRSAIRDVGKAIGLTLAQVDTVAREYDALESLERAAGVGETAGRLLTLCERIDGFPRHMGIHSGGMVITRDPLVEVAPVEWATMRDRTIIQWDKDDLQDLGLIKIDLLGLGMLSLLREAFSIHKRVYSAAILRPSTRLRMAQDDNTEPLALHTIPADDPQTYAMLQRADTIGVFQVESRAQQSMLPRMKPACFYDIVMQVAIIRPGPIQGQMIHPFLRRRAGLEPVTYPHPKLEPILKRTLGVPLFQEQGMRMAVEAAGFSPGQADQLRRAMGHKRSRARMLEIYPRLVDGMVQNGIDRPAAEQLFHMLEGFADYGFPESHAASFALLAYASAYVKCHFPAIFAAAILNVQPMGFYSTEVLVNDARRHGVTIKPVAVNASEYWSHVDQSGALRLGFHLVRGLGEAQRKSLENGLSGGGFRDILDFAQRTALGKEALENVAIAGAFAAWYDSRRAAMWALRGLDERETRGELGRMMDVEEPVAPLRALTGRQETAFDLWSTGVAPRQQPIVHFRPMLERQGVLVAQRLREMPSNLVCRVGGLVITRQRPGTAKGFVFLTLEDETGLVNVIVRPDVYERNRRVIRQSMALVIEGKLQKEGGSIDVLARRFWPFDAGGLLDGVRARNFH
ncbi:MAG: error-prone DNA polymerase [Candidatus Eremiobacteraeota bacterium]|nr:error-prone DNA polymerase [Candidatus Eremiobacteraeota bacterium]